jgi:malonyl-CoA decarboxylase
MPDRAVNKKIKELIALLKEIRILKEPSLDLLKKFQNQYLLVNRDDRGSFFEALVQAFHISRKQIAPDLESLQAVPDDRSDNWHRQVVELSRKIESPYRYIFAPFLNLPGGLKFLLDFRVDLLAVQRQTTVNLEYLDEDIATLFNLWFQQGLLVLQEITQDSPYRQIRFLKDHDLVHPMASLEEMGRRLGADRRCFALYHQAMLQEPVVFIEVALTRGLTRSIHEILGEASGSPDRVKAPDTAIFYSINNTQNGLAGLGLGKVLIFQVVEALKRDNPGIKTYATLSPIPGFWERYLKPSLQREPVHFTLTPERLKNFFPEKLRPAILDQSHRITGLETGDLLEALYQALNRADWIEQGEFSSLIRKPLIDSAYFYLTQEKNKRGHPLNPVASFHLGNGATVSPTNIHFGANRSAKGLDESCGLMVNYIYSQTWLHQIGRTMKALLPWKV